MVGEGGGLDEEIKENENSRNGKSSFDIENQPNQNQQEEDEEEEDDNFENGRWSSFRKDSLGF